jgi:hypothetical protein
MQHQANIRIRYLLTLLQPIKMPQLVIIPPGLINLILIVSQAMINNLIRHPLTQVPQRIKPPQVVIMPPCLINKTTVLKAIIRNHIRHPLIVLRPIKLPQLVTMKLCLTILIHIQHQANIRISHPLTLFPHINLIQVVTIPPCLIIQILIVFQAMINKHIRLPLTQIPILIKPPQVFTIPPCLTIRITTVPKAKKYRHKVPDILHRPNININNDIFI